MGKAPDLAEKVIAYITANPGLTVGKIHKATGVSTGYLWNLLPRLTDDGVLQRANVSDHNKATVYGYWIKGQKPNVQEHVERPAVALNTLPVAVTDDEIALAKLAAEQKFERLRVIEVEHLAQLLHANQGSIIRSAYERLGRSPVASIIAHARADAMQYHPEPAAPLADETLDSVLGNMDFDDAPEQHAKPEPVPEAPATTEPVTPTAPAVERKVELLAPQKPKVVLPVVGIIGLHPNRRQAILDEFKDVFNFEFWWSEEKDYRLKSIALKCEVVFVMEFVAHRHVEMLLSNGANIRRVRGDMRKLEDEMTAYLCKSNKPVAA